MLPLLFQAAAALADPAAQVQDAQQGVIVYPPSFFADARPEMAWDMIGRVPGFTFDGGDANVRGLAGAVGNVLIDGQRPASKTDRLEDILRRLPAKQVERIELIRGGAPGIDMQGKTVVVNVVRKAGGGSTALLAVSNRSLPTGRQQQGLRTEFTRTFTGGRLLEGSFVIGRGLDDGAGDGYREVRDGDGMVTQFADVETQGLAGQGLATAAYETPFLGGRMKLNGRVFRNHFRFDELDIDRIDGGVEQANDIEDTGEAELGVRYNRAFGARTSFEGFVIQQWRGVDFDAHFENASFDADFNLDRRTGETIGRGALKHQLTAKIALEGGGEAAFNWLKSRTAYAELGTSIALPAANVRVDEKRAEAFAAATWRPVETLSLEAGLRAERSTITSEGDVELEKSLSFIKPRAILTWQPDASRQVRFRIEKVVGQLNFNDFVASSSLAGSLVTAGNPDIDPEQAWVAEAAFEQRFWKKGAVVLTVRRSELKDVIDRAPVFTDGNEAFDAPGNIGDGRKDELIVSLTLPLDRLFIKGGILRGVSTWRDSEVTDPATGEKREISALKPVEWEAHFSQDLPQFRLTWGIDVYGGWRQSHYRLAQVETVKLRPFVIPFIDWKARSDISVRVEFGNVTRRNLVVTRQVYEGPRGANPLAYTDTLNREYGRIFYIRVRKTFGS